MNIWDPSTGTIHRSYDGPIAPSPPPSPPTYPLSKSPHPIFSLLKWSVPNPPSNIEAFSLDAKDKPQWISLSSDAVLDGPATSPPLSRLKVVVEPLHTWEHWAQSGTKELRPKALGIENGDGRCVSVGQWIQAVHEYAVPLGRMLCRCCDVWGEDEVGARFWYECAMGGSRSKDECLEFMVFLIEDTDEDEVERNWEGVEVRYRRDVASGTEVVDRGACR